MSGLKILVISCYDLFPMTNGGLIRIGRLAEGLARSESIDSVTLTYPTFRAEAIGDVLDNVWLKPIRLTGSDQSRTKRLLLGMVRGIPPFATGTFYRSYESAIIELLKTQHFDRIQLEQTAAAAYLPAIRSTSKTPILFDLHDVETYRIRQMPLPRSRRSRIGRIFQRLDRLVVQHWEVQALSVASGVCVVSEQERERLLTLMPNTRAVVTVISNGVTLQPEASNLGGDTLIMVGSLYYDPNYEAGNWVAREVMPLVWARRPETHLLIAGAGPPELNVANFVFDKRIEVQLNVPYIRDIYQHATIALIGVQSGGGAALKLLEALMFGVPVVSTSFGVRGYEPVPPCFITDTAAKMAEQIVALLDNLSEQKRLAKQGRLFVEKNFTWDQLGNRLAEFHKALGDQSTPDTGA